MKIIDFDEYRKAFEALQKWEMAYQEYWEKHGHREVPYLDSFGQWCYVKEGDDDETCEV